MSLDIQFGDEGRLVTFVFQGVSGVPTDLSSSLDYFVKVQTPKNVSKKYEMADLPFTTDGTDGSVVYTLVTGDIDEPGKWAGQGFVDQGGGNSFHTKKVQVYDVSGNIQDPA